MNKLTFKKNLTKIQENIVDHAKSSGRNVLLKQVNYISHNRKSTSHTLNNYLLSQIDRFFEHVPAPKQKPNHKPLILFNALKSTTDPSSNLLTYKGINLGSAINMKLAVKLSTLLKDKDL